MRWMSKTALLTAAVVGGGATVGHAGVFRPAPAPCCTTYYQKEPPVVRPVANVLPESVAPQATVVPAAQGQEVAANVSAETAGLQTATITITASDSALGNGGAGAGPGAVRLVNSKNLVLDFEVKGVGSSGLGNVELWYTRNGQLWQKFPTGNQTQSPFLIDVPEDGLYGFTVVAITGVGISTKHPQPGDIPQVWVEVDTAKPEVHLLSTQAGIDENGRTLMLRWSATDKNLGARPVTLLYAEQTQGPWTPFATNVENVGHYTWHISAGLPSQVLVKVEATDRIGNVGEDQTTMPAPIDLSRPSAIITRVERNGVITATPTSRQAAKPAQ